jgi:hypothetical protein
MLVPASQANVSWQLPRFVISSNPGCGDEESLATAVSGADEVQMRPGFAVMLERIRGNGVRTIIVDTPTGSRAT